MPRHGRQSLCTHQVALSVAVLIGACGPNDARTPTAPSEQPESAPNATWTYVEVRASNGNVRKATLVGDAPRHLAGALRVRESEYVHVAPPAMRDTKGDTNVRRAAAAFEAEFLRPRRLRRTDATLVLGESGRDTVFETQLFVDNVLRLRRIAARQLPAVRPLPSSGGRMRSAALGTSSETSGLITWQEEAILDLAPLWGSSALQDSTLLSEPDHLEYAVAAEVMQELFLSWELEYGHDSGSHVGRQGCGGAAPGFLFASTFSDPPCHHTKNFKDAAFAATYVAGSGAIVALVTPEPVFSKAAAAWFLKATFTSAVTAWGAWASWKDCVNSLPDIRASDLRQDSPLEAPFNSSSMRWST